MEQTERQLVSLLSEITPLYDVPMREAKARQDALAKPPGSLGLLEDLSVQLAGITGQVKNEVSHTRIYVLAADNGVVCEGVSSAPAVGHTGAGYQPDARSDRRVVSGEALRRRAGRRRPWASRSPMPARKF